MATPSLSEKLKQYLSIKRIKVHHSAHIMLYYEIPFQLERTKLIEILKQLYPEQKYIVNQIKKYHPFY